LEDFAASEAVLENVAFGENDKFWKLKLEVDGR